MQEWQWASSRSTTLMSAISSSLTMPLPTSNVQWMLYLLTTCLKIQLAPTSPCLVSIWTCWMSNRSWCMDLMGRFSGPRSRWRMLGSQMGSPNPFTLRAVPKWGCSRGWHTFWRSTDSYENAKNLHAQCPDFKCKPSALDCCCCCLFFNQLNFWDVKTLLEAFCTEWKSIPLWVELHGAVLGICQESIPWESYVLIKSRPWEECDSSTQFSACNIHLSVSFFPWHTWTEP